MSEPMQALRERMGEFTRQPYLISVTAEREPHCGTVQVSWGADGEQLLVEAPSSWPGSAASGYQQVSLLWPPDEPGGYSLIVDGTAEMADAGTRLGISIYKAVLHRRGEPTDASNTTCGSDCVPILKQALQH